MSGKRRKLYDTSYETFIEEARRPALVAAIDYSAGFSFGVQTNFLGGWAEDKARRLIFRLQRSLHEALSLSGFHNQTSLETRRFEDGLEFRFSDPDYEFTMSVDGRGRINLLRAGSSSKRFHEWYRRLMPSLPSIVQRTVAALDEEMTGVGRDEFDDDANESKWRAPAIQVEKASFTFTVVVQVSPEGAGDAVSAAATPNIAILNRTLLRQVPSSTGELVDPLEVEPNEFGRVTYQVNRWRDPDKILETYLVSGPSNNGWTTLVFDFGFTGDTYVPSVGERQPFAQKTFITGARMAEAYLDFYRDRALSGFMHGVLLGADEEGAAGLGGRSPLSAFRYSSVRTL
jgi:hypothetical protein